MFALFILLGSLALIAWVVSDMTHFMAIMKAGGWLAILLCFAKFFFLGTLGEISQVKRKTKSWHVACPWWRAFTWGFFGIWIGIVFVGIDKAVAGAMAAHYWPTCSGFWLALSKSFWINLFSGYAFSMMLTHGYSNYVIKGLDWGVLNVNIRNFVDDNNWQENVPFLMKTIAFFWIPMHTITFSLPPELRTLVAALLSIALGFLLSMKENRHSSKTS